MSTETIAGRLRWARRHHGKYATPTEAARAFGWPVSTYLGHENGDRNPSRGTAKKYARAYRVRWEWMLENEGVPLGNPEVPIVGKVSRSTEIIFYPKAEIRRVVELPPGGGSDTVAVEVLGGPMRGIADDHWLIYYDNEQRPPSAQLVGKLCVIELRSGAVLLRVLQPGRRKGRFDLESPTEPTLRDQEVRWAARVTWIKPV